MCSGCRLYSLCVVGVDYTVFVCSGCRLYSLCVAGVDCRVGMGIYIVQFVCVVGVDCTVCV